MNIRLFNLIAAVCLLFSNLESPAAETAPASGPKADLQELVGKIQKKMQTGKPTEALLAEDLKAFDVLIEKYKSQKTDEVATIVIMKAMLYLQVLDLPEKGLAVLGQLKKDFPDTAPGKQVDKIIESIQKQQEASKVKKSLVEGAVFPDFSEKDLNGKPLSIANHKGKVVLIDFWATWCGPCIGELPNVIKAYEKYHAKGFEIIGISLDEDEKALKDFLTERKMTWAQYFDGKGWQNKLAVKYGITGIPATFLVDGQGKIIAQDLRGDDLDKALEKALAKKP